MRTLVLFALLAACTKTETIRSEPTTPAPRSTVSIPNDPAFPRLDVLPPEYQVVYAPLGTPCTAASMADCGTDGRVSRVVGNMGFQLLPQGLYTLGSPSSSDFRKSVVTVGIEQERIWMASACRACRVMNTAITIVALRNAKDEALVQLQQALMLPTAPVLRTPAAFREALLGAGFSASKG